MQQPPSQQSTQGTGGAGSELRSDAQQIASTAASRLESEADARKGAAVSQAQSVSSAIQRTADGLDEGAPAWLKSVFQQSAQQIQRFADSIDQKDSRQLVSEAQDFARNNPGTFLLACAAAGFAAARVFKAGGEQQNAPSAQWDQDVRVDPVEGESAMFQSPTADAGAGTSPRGEFV